MTTSATGYGPRSARSIDATTTNVSSRFQRMCFDGNSASYQMWETKFLAYLYTKCKDAYDVITSSTAPTATNAEDNKMAFSELAQVIDDKSLQLIMHDAKNDGYKALQTLRNQYASVESPRILTLYSELTTITMRSDEDITDYLIRSENAATGLKAAGESISDNLIVAMSLKGLPSSFKTFVVVHTETSKSKSLSDK